MKLLLSAFAALFPLFLLAGEAVSPDTKSAFIAPPAPPARVGKTPPECVNHLLETVYQGEKEHFERTKSYSTSFIELRLGSKLGIGCTGWTFPALELTYGGTGYKATMTEDVTQITWTINQDKGLFGLDQRIVPLPPPADKPVKKP